MLDETDRPFAPWVVVATDDKKTARLNIGRYILSILNHTSVEVKKPDPKVVLSAAKAKGKLAR